MSDVFTLSYHDIKILLCYTALRTKDCSVARDCPHCLLRGTLANKNIAYEAMELTDRFIEAKKQGIKSIGIMDQKFKFQEIKTNEIQ
jgi:hypothetical protein